MGNAENSSKPGEVLTAVFKIENSTSHTIKAKPFWSLPSGWNAVSDDAPFDLPAGQSVVKLFSVHVSPGALAGRFAVQYEINDLFRSDVSGVFPMDIEVEEIQKIQITPGDAPDFVMAGKDIRATFILQNMGNSGQGIAVSAQNGILTEDGPFYLDPNEIKIIEIKTKTLATIDAEGRVFLRIFGNIENTPEIEANSYCFVRVLPRVERKLMNGHEIPVDVRISHLIRQLQDGTVINGFQGEVNASGSLDEAGKNHVELRLRGPDQFGLSLLGQYDEYYASFKNDKYYVHVGDKTFSLSPLTEFFRYGRGIEASIKSEGYEFGGFYQRPRFFSEIASETAGYVRYQYSEGNEISVNLLHKQYSNNRGDATLASLKGIFRPLNHTTLEGEVSRGLRQNAWGNGLFFRVDSRPLPKIQLAANLIYADRNFPGYFTNTLSFYGQINYQLTNRLSLSAWANQDENNASRDTLFGVSPWSKMVQFGVNYNFANNLTLRGFIRSNELKDRMPLLKFHYTEDVLRLQAVKNMERFQVTLTGEFGSRENLLRLPENRISRTYSTFADVGYRISTRHSFTGSVQYFQFSNKLEGKQEQWIFGGTVNSVLSPSTRLRFAFQTNYQLEDYYRNRNLLDFNFSQQLGKKRNHELSISANYILLQRTQQQKDFSIQVNYACRFGVSIGGKELRQGVRGQISNAGAKSVEGVVLILNGQSAKTAEDGSFYFENVPPGKHYLMLDPTSVQLHEIADLPLPLTVTVEPGIDARADFGLTRSVTVWGNVEIEPEKKNIKQPGKRDIKQVFIFEITDGVETFRRLSDASNHFEFPDIRPGKWTLRILNSDDINGFYFKRTEWELDIKAGESKEIEVELLRKRREVKFQDKLSLTGIGQ